jgi:hypothetical protein
MSLVKPVLKRLHSPDAFDLRNFSPPDPRCFGLLLQAMFGPEHQDGEESFDIVVCTPKWIEMEVERKQVVDGRHHMIVREFDLQQVQSFLVRYANECVGKTWEEAATKLSRLGKWEFEDYKA